MLNNDLLRDSIVAHLDRRNNDLLGICLSLNDNIIIICDWDWLLLLDSQLMRLLHVVGLILHLRVETWSRLLRIDYRRSVAAIGFVFVTKMILDISSVHASNIFKNNYKLI